MNEPTHNPHLMYITKHIYCACVLNKTAGEPESLFLHDGSCSHVTAATNDHFTKHTQWPATTALYVIQHIWNVCKWTVIAADSLLPEWLLMVIWRRAEEVLYLIKRGGSEKESWKMTGFGCLTLLQLATLLRIVLIAWELNVSGLCPAFTFVKNCCWSLSLLLYPSWNVLDC